MTSNEIKRKIAELIGKNFFSFGAYKTKEGTEFKIHGEKMEIGMPIYVITPEGELPVTEGEYEMENGLKLKIAEGAITNIEDSLNTNGTPIDEIAGDDSVDGEDMEETKMEEVSLIDGTIVGTDGEIAVGKNLYVKTEDGEFVQAPEGTHSTETMTLVVDSEGVITGLKKEGEKGEGSLAETEMSAEDLLSVFTSAVKELTASINTLRSEHSQLKERFEVVAGQPAGDRVFDRQGYFQDLEVSKFSKMEQMSALRNKK